MFRSLIFFWPRNLAVACGAAITTAVLTGALVIGDSMQSSLRNLTLDRLGEVDFALTSDRLFGDTFASRLSGHPRFPTHFDHSVPALILRGTAIHGESGARASAVRVYGVDNRFSALYPSSSESPSLDLQRDPGQLFPSAVINESLSRELGAQTGDAILLSYQRISGIPAGSLLGSREGAAKLDSLRLTVRAVLPDRQLGRFGLETKQYLPLNVFVSLDALQESLDLDGQVNSLLVSAVSSAPDDPLQTANRVEVLQELVADRLTLNDLGITVKAGDRKATIESREFVLRPQIVVAATQVATEAGLEVLPIITYLANEMRLNERSLPYSTVAALPARALASLQSVNDSNRADHRGEAGTRPDFSHIAANEILLNQWAANDLEAQVGDLLTMEFYVVDSRDELETATADFQIAGIVKMEGLAGDPELTPAYPGISDAAHMSDWDPPFPVDLAAIRPQDEDYWDLYQATPKAFVTLTTGGDLWRSRFGELTSMRIIFPADAEVAPLLQQFEADFLAELSPASLGLEFRAVKAQGLAAAKGATDFTGLFLGFSMFLIASAALLVGLLFSLNVDRRAKEVGLRLAIGTPVRTVRNQLLAEGGVVAALGGLAGTVLAIGYAHWLMGALTSWWLALVDSPFLALDIQLPTLVAGYCGSMLLVLGVIWKTTRRLTQNTSSALLAGSTAEFGARAKVRSGRRIRFYGWCCIAIAVALLFASTILDAQSPALFFGIGTSLCAAGITFFSSWCHRSGGTSGFSRLPPLTQIAIRSSARSPGRSLLSVALVSSACFVLVSVGANRHTTPSSSYSNSSGTGGFALVAGTDTPLDNLRQFQRAFPTFANSESGSPSSPESKSGLPADVEIYPMRLLPGEDASCLNLYQPEKPRVLGVPPDFIETGRFQFQQAAQSLENPWELLLGKSEPGVVPAIADYNSAVWILHLGLGEDVELQDGHGNDIKLRLVGLLETSIFQSEILISEENFLQHFPDRAGYSYFLVDLPEGQVQTTSQALEANLSDYGLDTTPAATKLAGFQAVENMYLKTFQVLGALGLLLGTVGLGIVVIRNVIERRGELATLRAFGFRRGSITLIVLLENAFLLCVGIGIGSVSGFAAVAPHVLSAGSQVPWGTLAGTLASVLAVGVAASAIGVLTSLRIPLLPALKKQGFGT